MFKHLWHLPTLLRRARFLWWPAGQHSARQAFEVSGLAWKGSIAPVPDFLEYTGRGPRLNCHFIHRGWLPSADRLREASMVDSTAPWTSGASPGFRTGLPSSWPAARRCTGSPLGLAHPMVNHQEPQHPPVSQPNQ